MKRFVRLILLFTAATLFLAACGQAKLENMEYIKHEDGSYGDKIRWNDRVYSFWSAIDNTVQVDKQIGIIDGDKTEKVFSARGYSSDDWLIEYTDVEMSVYSLYKADSVTDIPDALAKLKKN